MLTTDEFMKEWRAGYDWLPYHIVLKINQGYDKKEEKRTLFIKAPNESRWMAVADRK